VRRNRGDIPGGRRGVDGVSKTGCTEKGTKIRFEQTDHEGGLKGGERPGKKEIKEKVDFKRSCTLHEKERMPS